MEFDGLTAKQARFIEEYLVDFNATQAAIRAGYSEETAGVIGYENLKKPYIQAEIRKRQADTAAALSITREAVLRELKRIAFSDMRRFAEFKDGTLKITDSEDLTEDESPAISELSMSESESTTDTGSSSSRTRKVKLHDKVKALENLSKHLGLLDPDPTKTPPVTINLNYNLDEGEDE